MQVSWPWNSCDTYFTIPLLQNHALKNIKFTLKIAKTVPARYTDNITCQRNTARLSIKVHLALHNLSLTSHLLHLPYSTITQVALNQTLKPTRKNLTKHCKGENNVLPGVQVSSSLARCITRLSLPHHQEVTIRGASQSDISPVKLDHKYEATLKLDHKRFFFANVSIPDKI